VGFVESDRLSLATCRRLLGRSVGLSDADLERLREQMYELAGAIVCLYQPPERLAEESALQMVANDDRASIEERAAILEFDAHMNRDAAIRVSIASHLRGLVTEDADRSK
jgi:hypothetical protein